MAHIKEPPYNARAVANHFLELAKRDGKTLDPMKIQKLVYLAHGWSLALLGKPLITDKIEAWKYGPVIRSLYSTFADAGSGPISRPALEARWVNKRLEYTISRIEGIDEWSNQGVKNLLEEVWRVYSGFTAFQLSNYSHEPGSPWAQTWQPGVDGLVIPDEVIKTYFCSLAAKNEPAG